MFAQYIKALSLIFIAEMGDKTQLLAMTLATRYSPFQVLSGIFIGVLLNHGIAILAGIFLSNVVPLTFLEIIAGVLFILFGFAAIDEDTEEGEKNGRSIILGPIKTVALAFFVGELGDKTQLTAMTLAMSDEYPLMILAGTVCGMVLVGSIGIIVGVYLNKKIPVNIMKILSGFIFIFFGVTKLFTSSYIFMDNEFNQSMLIIFTVLVALYRSSRLLIINKHKKAV